MLKKNYSLSSLFFSFLFFLTFSAYFSVGRGYGSEAGDVHVKKLRCASIAPESSLFATLLKDLGNRVEKETGVKISWYLGGAVGDEIDIVHGLKKGVYDCAALTVNGLGFISAYFRVLDLPFLIKNVREAGYVRKRVFPLFRKICSDRGYEFLGFLDVGFVHIFSKEPLRILEDLKNRSFWVWVGNVIMIHSFDVFKMFGINKVPVNIYDLPIFAKDIDIVWFPKYAIIAYGFWRYFKYMMEEPIMFFMAGIIVKSEVFASLPDEKKEKIRTIAYEYADIFSEKIMEENQQAEEFLLKNGIKKVSFRDIKKLEKVFKEKMWEEFRRRYIPEWLMVSILKEVIKIRTELNSE